MSSGFFVVSSLMSKHLDSIWHTMMLQQSPVNSYTLTSLCVIGVHSCFQVFVSFFHFWDKFSLIFHVKYNLISTEKNQQQLPSALWEKDVTMSCPIKKRECNGINEQLYHFKHANYFILPKWIISRTLWVEQNNKTKHFFLLLFWEGNRCQTRLNDFSNRTWTGTVELRLEVGSPCSWTSDVCSICTDLSRCAR